MTLSLFAESDEHVGREGVQLTLTLDSRSWLSLLAEKWWPVRSSPTPIVLGVGKPVIQGDRNAKTEVTAWLDLAVLMLERVQVLRHSKWQECLLGEVTEGDVAVAWHGPLPLTAIKRFTVGSDEQQAHLLAMAQGFANLESPRQPVEVEQLEPLQVPTPFQVKARSKLAASRYSPPESWNAFRGAAAMAVWAVPSIRPWLDVLCNMLSAKPAKNCRTELQAPWLNQPAWQVAEQKPTKNGRSRDLILWSAIIRTLTNIRIKEAWRPAEVLEQICDDARHNGAPPSSLDGLLFTTSSILDDTQTVDIGFGAVDPLGMALQLVLLRPRPEQFVTWRNDLPALPPAIWWTGAILSGLINGYRNLDLKYRPDDATGALLDSITWVTRQPSPWGVLSPLPLTCTIKENSAYLSTENGTWLTRELGRRGRWYEADLNTTEVKALAIIQAAALAPATLKQRIKLSGSSSFESQSAIKIDNKRKTITVAGEGDAYLELNDRIELVEHLDSAAFKCWLASAGEARALPKLPVQKQLEIPPAGLRVVENFLSEADEQRLLRLINEGPWSNELKRRVQHYGWKYDYRARQIRPDAYLGPLPAWADQIAERLVTLGLMPEKPDQVIVNEYVTLQGISAHVDCRTCFKGPVVTISLLESWHMLFRNGKARHEVLLPRSSATVMAGPARDEWTHEIPARKQESGVPRTRRVSLTFRKVNVAG
ncbi:alpha-ketoglutarate-dependent dioxygenase AlkB [Pseudomonas sp. TE3610]